jgi:hypothetical protein
MVNLVAGMTPPKKDFWDAFYRRFIGLTSVALSSARTGPQGWRFGSEWVAGMDRNQWPLSIGIGGRIASEYAEERSRMGEYPY